MTGNDRKPVKGAFRDLYRQARDQAAERANYDVQAGLARLSEWMDRDEPGSQPAEGVSPTGQGSLFELEEIDVPDDAGYTRADEQSLPSTREDIGYRGPTACAAAGVTYRQLDYWARTGLVKPSIRTATGSGSQRLYSFRDILVLKITKRLLDTGISLRQIRAAVTYLREQGAGDLTQVTLMSDGASVYACTSPDQVADLLQGGQGVFGIALGRIWQEIEGTLAGLVSEQAEDPRDTTPVSGKPDELARRRVGRAG